MKSENEKTGRKSLSTELCIQGQWQSIAKSLRHFLNTNKYRLRIKK
jgi:hypothetical protein